MTAVNKNRQLNNNITSMLLLWPAQCPAVFGSLVKKKKNMMELTGHVSVSTVGMWAVIWCQGFLSPLAPELAGPSLSSHQSYMGAAAVQHNYSSFSSPDSSFSDPCSITQSTRCAFFLSQMMESPQFFWAHGWWRCSHRPCYIKQVCDHLEVVLFTVH